MDMIGDIVERTDSGPVTAPGPSAAASAADGPKKAAKMSAWRNRQVSRKNGAGSAGASVSQGAGGGLANSKIAAALSGDVRRRPASGGAAAEKKPRQFQQAEQVPEQMPEFSESERIHIENLERLAQMTEQEIEAEREQILGNMDVNVLRGLLRRAEMREAGDGNEFGGVMDAGDVDAALNPSAVRAQPQKTATKTKTQPPKEPSKSFSIADVGVEGLVDGSERYPSFEDLQKAEAAMDEAEREKLGASNVHFPVDPAQATPSDALLDPQDPQFFDKLHAKYYPTLAAEPDKMAWMQPVPEDDTAAQEGLLPSELRFDFKGQLVSPRVGGSIPTHAGLHHHGDAPSLAGYTVLELAHLARSSHSGQRSMAIQTLGRVLFRLGKGAFGPDISAGVYGLVDRARVLETLQEASDEAATRSLSVRAYAVEALWLWKQSGGYRPAI